MQHIGLSSIRWLVFGSGLLIRKYRSKNMVSVGVKV